MQIGELSRNTGVPIQTIRYYEKERLLEPTTRSEGNFRLFDNTALEQLLFIKQCRSLDLNLSEIRELIKLNSTPQSKCHNVIRMIDQHVEQVEQRIQELHILNKKLTALRDSCSPDRKIENCGILSSLSTT